MLRFIILQFAAAVVHLFLCRHYVARFYQIVSMDAPVCMATDCLLFIIIYYNVNYKDP